jgi:hypothetical protein
VQTAAELSLLSQVSDEGAVKLGDVAAALGEKSVIAIESEWRDDGDGGGSEARNSARKCFRDKRIVMVGDSMMRYQYLALVYWLENGTQPPAGFHGVVDGMLPGNKSGTESPASWDKESICNEYSWKELRGDQFYGRGWNHFYAGTSRLLNGHEHCDCWRQDHLHSVENRYYRLPEDNISVSYFSWAGQNSPSSMTHGHWREGWVGSDVGETTCSAGKCNDSVTGAWGPDQLFDEVIVPLRPTHLLINCGLWFPNAGKCVDTEFISKIMGAAGTGTVLWKTTTLVMGEETPVWVKEVTEDFRAAGAQIWDAAAVMKPLVRANSTLYWEMHHTHCFVHNALNANLAHVLCG